MTAIPDPNEAVRNTSRQNRIQVAKIRLLGRLLGNGEWLAKLVVKAAKRPKRRGREPAEAAPPRRAVRGLDVRHSKHAGWPVWSLVPSKPSTRIILYFHGGGYVGQANKMQYTWCADVARNTGATIVVPIYPLAPTGTAATVVPVAADLIESLITAYGAENITLTGDSAGGGLALAAVQELVRRGSTIPGRLVLISPWLDVTIGDPASMAIDVPAAGVKILRAGGRLWAGDADPTDPRVSPLFGSMVGLPRTIIFGGTFDVLHPDTVRLQQRASAEGVHVETVIADGLGHVWPLYPYLPEAIRIQPQLRETLVGGP
ncbi:alpha/beta hydrolase fold domain-containing protein [Mycobacterium sp. AT1]|uniref:alpha/beta hydrolase fold domain-containing protein n=1 Tax=Mycobacterium sp. AT1 TaxID=1961706 RepID=UPI0009AEBFF1|nr:alpha/beta hydrolase fold domain-containing protein [Mycobacterium sp. AT1]OPX12479.1 hypothetical protein B1790_03230 [Mycobacterium sp. AT1]